MTHVRWIPVVLCVFFLPQNGRSQEVFREYTYSYGASRSTHFSELDPNTKREFAGEHSGMANKVRHAPKPLILDLEGAIRAELAVEYWGGHIGTSGQRFRVNDHDWIDLPQPIGTPTEPQKYYRVLRGNNAVPIPLGQLKHGENVFRFTAGRQVEEYFNDWGFYWIYDFTIRIVYDRASKTCPSGQIEWMHDGLEFGDTMRIGVKLEPSDARIARVEFIGEYDDFDWDGDGVWREWQYATRHGVLCHHLGTATDSPWQIRFDARWLPDQDAPIRVRARITDVNGYTSFTPPKENIVQKRPARGVRMIKPREVPERWASRAGRESPVGSFHVEPDDLAEATFARLVLSTWSGDVDDTSTHELRLNGSRLASRFGEFHDEDLDVVEVPLQQLKVGRNEITTYSTFKGHMFEINWPGPALLIEYKK